MSWLFTQIIIFSCWRDDASLIHLQVEKHFFQSDERTKKKKNACSAAANNRQDAAAWAACVCVCLTEAMQAKGEPFGRRFSGKPEGKQRKQDPHDVC